jgi:glycosyltransferase involved in cell wall biosynthesis
MILKNKVIIDAKRNDEYRLCAYSLFNRVLVEFDCKIGVEVGVSFGGHSEVILSETKVEKLYGVDPYGHFGEYGHPLNVTQKEFDSIYEFTKGRLAVFENRFEIIRMASSEAVSILQGSIDFVYFNSLNTYEGVFEVIKIWFSRVKNGGIIGGYDYGNPNFPWVKQAIDEFFKRFNLEIHELGEGIWWVEKKSISISFIIPAFNCSNTIVETIESIMDGNFEKGDEVVICNDNSSDETEDVLNKLKFKYSDITIINHLRNKGGAAARNTAVENTKNNLLFCIDSDNILVRNSVAKLKEFLINSGADIAAFQELHYFSDSRDYITHKWIFKEGQTGLSDYLSGSIVPGASGNYMFTKNSWHRAGGYPEDAGALDAWGFGFRQVATDSIMKVMPNSHYFHRYGHESYWVRDSKKGKISLTALQIIFPFLHLFLEADINFILNQKHRYNWFENLEKKPVRLKNKSLGSSGTMINYSLESDPDNKDQWNYVTFKKYLLKLLRR